MNWPLFLCICSIAFNSLGITLRFFSGENPKRVRYADIFNRVGSLMLWAYFSWVIPIVAIPLFVLFTAGYLWINIDYKTRTLKEGDLVYLTCKILHYDFEGTPSKTFAVFKDSDPKEIEEISTFAILIRDDRDKAWSNVHVKTVTPNLEYHCPTGCGMYHHIKSENIISIKPAKVNWMFQAYLEKDTENPLTQP